MRVFPGRDQSFAVRADGSLWAWVDNTYRTLCVGRTPLGPVPVTRTSFGGRLLALDTRFTTAIVPGNGQVRTCGSWPLARDGDGWYPVVVHGITGARNVAVGANAVYIRRSDHSVWGWGEGENGQLGSVTASEVTVPLPEITATHLDAGGRRVAWIEPPTP